MDNPAWRYAETGEGISAGNFDAVITDPPYASGERSRMKETVLPIRNTAV